MVYFMRKWCVLQTCEFVHYQARLAAVRDDRRPARPHDGRRVILNEDVSHSGSGSSAVGFVPPAAEFKVKVDAQPQGRHHGAAVR